MTSSALPAAPPHLEVNARVSAIDVTVISISGELDFYTAPLLRDTLYEAATQRSPRIVLDLTDLDFLDSTGLGVLIAGCKKTRERQGALALASLKPNVEKTVRMAGLIKVFMIFDTVEAAESGIARPAQDTPECEGLK